MYTNFHGKNVKIGTKKDADGKEYLELPTDIRKEDRGTKLVFFCPPKIDTKICEPPKNN